MKLNFDFSPWISPVSGNIAFWQSFPDLPVNYTIEGDRENRPQPSSALIDVRLDIIGLRHAIDNLEQRPYPDLDATYILQQPNANLPNAQALNQLSDGLMKNNGGVIVNASLTNGMFWQGDANNTPVEVELKIAPNDATYIIKTPNANLPQAQVLSELGIGMAKIVAGGAFAIAVAGEDYATAQQLEEIRDQCQQYAEQAATSAEEAAASATEAATSATEATTAAGEATVAAGEATVAAGEASASAGAATVSALAAGISAGSASSSARSASSSADDASDSASNAADSASNAAGSASAAAGSATQAQTYLNTLLTTRLTLQGDLNGSGLLSSPIVTTFKPNPVFSGNQSMAMPSGNSSQRPTTLIPGMIRFNTSL